MSNNPRQGSQSAPLPDRRFSLAVVSTPEVPFAQVAPIVQLHLPDPQPQPIYVEEAPPESLNSTFEYYLEAEEIPAATSKGP